VKKPLILGISASLRNARSKKGSQALVTEISALTDSAELNTYINDQASIHLDQFVDAGRAEGKPFDQLYRELRKRGGLRGLSNSEVCLAAALWEAKNHGCDIDHVGLIDHFPADGSETDIDVLKTRLKAADGFILSSPVYFGDRSSLSQRFIEMIRSDDDLRRILAGKIYAGLAVGAKRNGGQETTLIYQMIDMINLDLLGVGNDSDTTSQYGGTAHAGDIGTIPKDTYGINTSRGTGRRIGRVAAMMEDGKDSQLGDKIRVGLWSLQDRNSEMLDLALPLFRTQNLAHEVRVSGVTDHRIRPCIACDICPIAVGPDEDYRCIIARKDDGLKQLHEELLWPDILVPAVLSPRSRNGLVSVYQQFMERTRYLRRGDYVYTDRLVIPLVFEEIGANEHLDIRLLTSFIRHHTVMSKPIIGFLHQGKLINEAEVAADLGKALANGRRLTESRLAAASLSGGASQYNPVGYVLSAAKDNENDTLTAREEAIEIRNRNLVAEAASRLCALPRNADTRASL